MNSGNWLFLMLNLPFYVALEINLQENLYIEFDFTRN